MIHSFRFNNFYSFKESFSVDFSVKEPSFTSKDYNVFLNNVSVFIGPNGSGKTNALRVLAFLFWFARHSYNEDKKSLIAFEPFFKRKDFSTFEVVFSSKKSIYKYFLEARQDRVLKEELYEKNLKTNSYNYLIKRSWDEKNEKNYLDIKNLNGVKKENVFKMLRKNASILSLLKKTVENLEKIDDVFCGFNVFSNVPKYNSQSMESFLFEASKFYLENKTLFDKAKDILVSFDLGLSDIKLIEKEFVTKDNRLKKLYVPYGVHCLDKSYDLPFFLESKGIQSLFITLTFILRALEHGGVAVCDELHLDFHPHIMPKILELFADPEINTQKAQLLFSSHSIEILNYLNKEQIFITEKSEKCESEIFRLDSLKGIRRDENMYSKYMAGAYGGVPNI